MGCALSLFWFATPRVLIILLSACIQAQLVIGDVASTVLKVLRVWPVEALGEELCVVKFGDLARAQHTSSRSILPPASLFILTSTTICHQWSSVCVGLCSSQSRHACMHLARDITACASTTPARSAWLSCFILHPIMHLPAIHYHSSGDNPCLSLVAAWL